MNSVNSVLNLNYPPTPSSAMLALSPASPMEGSKKRLFMRKPCASPNYVLAERRKKQSEQGMNNQQAIIQGLKSWRDKIRDEQSASGSKKLQEKQQKYTKTKEDQHTQELFYNPNPNASQKQLLLGMKYINRPPVNQTIQTDYASHRPLRQHRRDGDKKELDETVDVSGESQMAGNRVGLKIQHKSFKSQRPYRMLERQPNQQKDKMRDTRKSLRIEVTTEKTCPHCSANQENVQMLQSTVAQLQRQIEEQTRHISDLSQKNNRLKSQKINVERQLSCVIQGLQQRTRRGERDLACTFQAAKEEIAKLKDRLKYLEMQNGVLLRYKEDFGQMIKEIDKYKHENATFRRQLNTIAQMERVQKGKGINKAKVDPVKGKISLRKTKQEDLISLNLSEWSCQQN